MLVLERAINEFILDVKIDIHNYLADNEDFPKDKRLMVNMAIAHFLNNVFGLNFSFTLFADTEYAKYVHRKGEKGIHFFPKVQKGVTKIMEQQLRLTLSGFFELGEVSIP